MRPDGAEGISDPLLLEALQRVSARGTSSPGGGRLIAAISDEIMSLFQADAAAVFRYDGDETVVVASSAASGHTVFTPGARFPLEPQMVAAQIREDPRPVRSAQYDRDPSDAGRRVSALGVTVVIGAPIHLHGELWGVVYAGSASKDRLPEGSEARLGLFAELCAIAAANDDTAAKLEAQTAERRAILRLAGTSLGGAEEGEVLAAIAREIAVMLGATAAVLLRDGGDGFRVASQWSAGDPVAVPGERFDDEVAERVRERRRIERVGDPDTTARPDERTVLGRPVGWAAPLGLGERFWGVVLVAGEQGTPTPDDAPERIARFLELAELLIDNVETRRVLADQLVLTQEFAALVEGSDDFIALAGLDGGTRYVNAGGRRLLGIDSQEEARRYRIRDYLTEEGKRHFEAVSGPAVRGQGAFRGETTLRHFKTGEAIPVSVVAFLIDHPISGEPTAVAVIQHDLRERKTAEVELRRHAERVEELATARRRLLVEVLRSEERMRGQIADALHDDVLQELYAARLDVDRLGEDEEAADRVRAGLEAASRQVRNAVGDLHPAAASAQNLRGRLRAIAEQGGERAGFGVRVECSLDGSTGIDELIVALAREFVHNAVKHAEATFVVVRVAEDGADLVVEVSDDGRGMAPQRVDSAVREGHIGLAAARERVDAVGGELVVDSRPGEGTRVRVTVPRDRAMLSDDPAGA